MRKFAVLAVAVVFTTTLLAFASAEDVERKQIVAVRTDKSPRIDGDLDDSVWQKAQSSEDFIQTKPNRGEPMNQQTVIRILYDSENIYFGFQCYDSEPEKVLGTEMRRDYDVWETNDYIRFVMDTYHDLRNGYYFGTNPLGAKVDARVTDNGNFYKTWDAVWECAARRHSQGWSAEFSIPFGQLRFPKKDNHIWGFNCARTIRRTDEEGCWSSIQVDNVNVLSGAGELVGLEDLPQGHRLELRPIVVLGAEANHNGGTDVDVVKDPSLDIKYGLTSGLTLDATVNTDFAQVEADEERVNLSRFDMYFEEKRPFFLEGVGIFDTSMPLFYSRRIGSAGDKEAQILGGLKLTGKVGKQSLGLLSVQTDKVDETPATNFSAFRIQRDVFRSSSAGIICLNKAPWEGGEDNQTLGADLRFNPRDELSISSSLAKTWKDDLSGSDLAGQISGHWKAETWDLGASYRDIQENFNAEMGFITRTDIRGADLWGGKSFQIRKGIFRSAGGGGHYGITTDHHGRLESRDFGFEYGLELETGDSCGIGAERRWEYLEEDWEIREGLVIPKGLHRWYRYGFGMGTDDSRWLKIGGSHGRGGFYNGDRLDASLNGHIRPVPKLLITGSYSWNSIELPDGSFSTNTINSRSIYTFSPDLFIKLFLQWNDDSEVVRGNFLLRYTYRPGSDLYIVYNELWQGGDAEQRSIVAKLTYFLNI